MAGPVAVVVAEVVLLVVGIVLELVVVDVLLGEVEVDV
jgi:hypothetical protein